MRSLDIQVIIYFDDPDGQLMQCSVATFRASWKDLGWHILGRAPALTIEIKPEINTQGILI